MYRVQITVVVDMVTVLVFEYNQIHDILYILLYTDVIIDPVFVAQLF